MFPPRENRFRLVGGIDMSSEPASKRAEPEPEENCAWLSREGMARRIREHEDARTAYSRAALWAAQAEAENLSPVQIDDARTKALLAGAELAECGRSLVVGMPTDLKALVDLLMYLEKHFSLLPQEINGRSLAFFMLSTVRMSLRAVTKYGKHGGGDQ